MWKDILKVDRFSSEFDFKGNYDSEDDTINMNLDRFVTRANNFSDMDRINEFVEAVTHEERHRQYSKELQKYMDESVRKIMQTSKEYLEISKDNLEQRKKLLEVLRKDLQSYFNYAILNEKFASEGEDRGSLFPYMRNVIQQIFEKIGSDRLLEKLKNEFYNEIKEVVD
tara:strand:- start:240 stop:746 length:507 start_codon:yes stop_codon:yes gene_type:complete